MNYQVLDVKVKDTEEIGKLYTYFLDNSQEIDPNRVRPVIVICPVFYTMAVYFGAVQIKKTRYTLAGALFSSLVGMAVSIALAKGV